MVGMVSALRTNNVGSKFGTRPVTLSLRNCGRTDHVSEVCRCFRCIIRCRVGAAGGACAESMAGTDWTFRDTGLGLVDCDGRYGKPLHMGMAVSTKMMASSES